MHHSAAQMYVQMIISGSSGGLSSTGSTPLSLSVILLGHRPAGSSWKPWAQSFLRPIPLSGAASPARLARWDEQVRDGAPQAPAHSQLL